MTIYCYLYTYTTPKIANIVLLVYLNVRISFDAFDNASLPLDFGNKTTTSFGEQIINSLHMCQKVFVYKKHVR